MSNLVTKAVTSAILKDEEDGLILQPKIDAMNLVEMGLQKKADGTVATPVDDAPVGDEIIFQLLENFYNPRRPKHSATKENYINQILSKASNLFGEYQNINQDDLTKKTIQNVLPETVDFAQALADKEGYSDKRMMTSWNKSGGLEFDDATGEGSFRDLPIWQKHGWDRRNLLAQNLGMGTGWEQNWWNLFKKHGLARTIENRFGLSGGGFRNPWSTERSFTPDEDIYKKLAWQGLGWDIGNDPQNPAFTRGDIYKDRISTVTDLLPSHPANVWGQPPSDVLLPEALQKIIEMYGEDVALKSGKEGTKANLWELEPLVHVSEEGDTTGVVNPYNILGGLIQGGNLTGDNLESQVSQILELLVPRAPHGNKPEIWEKSNELEVDPRNVLPFIPDEYPYKSGG